MVGREASDGSYISTDLMEWIERKKKKKKEEKRTRMKNPGRISRDPAAAYNPEAFLRTTLVVDFF